MIDRARCPVAGRVNPYTRRLPMSLHAPLGDVISEQNIQVARAAFPKGNSYIRMREALGTRLNVRVAPDDGF